MSDLVTTPVTGSAFPPAGLLAHLAEAERREAAELLAELDTRRAQRDCLYWLQHCTATRDEQDAVEPYKPFPERAYFRPLIALFHVEPVILLEKSRTMMASWLVAGWALHFAALNQATRVVFQSRDEERALKLVDYCRTLWQQSTERIRAAWPLADKPKRYNTVELANGSSLIGIVGDPDKIRSEHPTIYVSDEAAYIPEFEACWAAASQTRAPHLIALSSVQPSAFCDLVADAAPEPWPGSTSLPARRSDGVLDPSSDVAVYAHPCYGLTFRRSKQGWAVPRVHYAADTALTADAIETLRRKSPTAGHWRQEMEIEATALEGQLLYPEFAPAIHVVDDDAVPALLCRYMAIDPHPRTPHAMLWAGVDHFGDVWVYRELWPSVAYGRAQNPRDDEAENEFTTKEYAETIAHLERCEMEWRHSGTDHESALVRPHPGGEKVLTRYMDVAGKGFKVTAEGQAFESYATRYARYGIVCSDPIRWHSAGEDAIRDLLRVRGHEIHGQWPRLHITRSCPEMIWEFQRARYAPMRGEPGEKEVPQESLKVRTHLIDCLRYLATAQMQFSYALASYMGAPEKVAA